MSNIREKNITKIEKKNIKTIKLSPRAGAKKKFTSYQSVHFRTLRCKYKPEIVLLTLLCIPRLIFSGGCVKFAYFRLPRDTQ